MYSTKHIENILLAELSRTQHNKWFSDSLKETNTTLRDIAKLHKTPTFQSIFNGKRRIFIPLELEEPTEEEKRSIQMSSVKKLSYDTQTMIKDCYYIIYLAYFTSISDDISNFSKINNSVKQIINNIGSVVIQFTEGVIYNPKINKPEKFGRFVNKLIDTIVRNNILSKIEENADTAKMLRNWCSLITIKEKTPDNILEALQMILHLFNGRKDWLPQDFLSSFIDTDNKYYAVISCDPQDVGAMSTGQGWSSCQDLDKDSKGEVLYDNWNWHTLYDVPMGTCVAYLLSEQKWKQSEKDFTKARSDWFEQNKNKFAKDKIYFKNAPIKGATARIAIKPFYGINKGNQGQLYLSIGTNPLVYGTTHLEKYFVEAVDEYLISKQSFLNGEFEIPKELYNEGLGNGSHRSNANGVIVENGKIVGLIGKNEMLRYRPNRNVDEEKLSVVQDVFSFLTQNDERTYYFNEIINSNLYSSEYLEFNRVKMVDCTFDRVEEINIDEIWHYSYSQFMSDLINYSGLSSYDRDELQNFFGYPIDDIYEIIEWTKEYYHRNIDFGFSDAINCSFENTVIKYYNIGNLFGNCEFNDCVIYANIRKPFDYNFVNSVFNDCNLRMGRGFSDDRDNKNIAQIGKNQYNNVKFDLSFSLSIRKTDKFIFNEDNFTNCSILTEDKYVFGLDDEELSELAPCIKFVNCTVNGEKLDGTYIFNDNAIASKNFEIKPENLIKEN